MPTYQKCAEALLCVRQSIMLSLIHVSYNAKIILITFVGIESLLLEMKKLRLGEIEQFVWGDTVRESPK